MKRTDINPQLRQHRAQQAFQRNVAKLWLELRSGTPRRYLDVLVELCEALLPECGSSQLTNAYRSELAEAKRQVSQRSNLRLVQ